MEAGLRHAQPAEAFPLRMDPAERLQAATQPEDLPAQAATWMGGGHSAVANTRHAGE